MLLLAVIVKANYLFVSSMKNVIVQADLGLPKSKTKHQHLNILRYKTIVWYRIKQSEVMVGRTEENSHR